MKKLTGKERSRRIDRFYYENLDPFIKRKRTAGIVGLLLGLAYSLWAFSSNGAIQFSPGQLSHAHAAWDESKSCNKCHHDNVPIRPDAVFGKTSENVALNNASCNTSECHRMAGHFDKISRPEKLTPESCVDCHREHQGRNLNLVKLADNTCNNCHAFADSEKASLRKDWKVASVSDFSTGHPEFRSLKNDPGTIKFSHSQHMRPGQPVRPGDGTQIDLNKIPVAYRDRYASRVDSNGLVQLQCNDCHQPDSNSSTNVQLASLSNQPNSFLKSSNEHLGYEKIQFETHCIACHSMNGIEHGLDREKTIASIQSTANESEIRELMELTQPAPDDLNTTAASLKSDIQRSITELKPRLVALLSSKDWCMKCHTLEPANSAQIVVPSNIPVRWLKGATFPHGDHQMVDCKLCHVEPYQDRLFGEKSDDGVDKAIKEQQNQSQLVMIKQIGICQECHITDSAARATKFSNGQAHVATANCVDCHRYHTDTGHLETGHSEKSASTVGHDLNSSEWELVRRFVTREAAN